MSNIFIKDKNNNIVIKDSDSDAIDVCIDGNKCTIIRTKNGKSTISIIKGGNNNTTINSNNVVNSNNVTDTGKIKEVYISSTTVTKGVNSSTIRDKCRFREEINKTKEILKRLKIYKE